MLDYQTIDALCDAINPSLFILSIIGICWHFKQRNIVTVKQQLLFLLSALLIVYGLKFVDHKLTIWPAFNSDYSTHTAFIIAMCAVLYRQFKRPFLWIATALVYMGLMRYQQYHSWLDMVSTSIVISILLFALHHQLKPRTTARYLNT